MTRKGAFVLVCLSCAGLLVWGASSMLAGPVIGALVTLLGAAAAITTKPLRDRYEHWVSENVNVYPRQCRILVYGLGRSGKTTIIRRLLTSDKPRHEVSTRAFDVYQETLRLSLDDSRKYPVACADYKGQQPSQILVDPPENFFGLPGRRMVNVIFFVCDLFPELGQEELLRIDAFLQRYERDADALIKQRVAQHTEYVSKWSIEPVFAVAYSKTNLVAVRLVINKLDLLRSVVARGYLPRVRHDDLLEYALSLYEDTAREIRRACHVNGIDDVSVHVVSAETGENLDALFGEILDGYRRRAA